jgi:hypothetical protein
VIKANTWISEALVAEKAARTLFISQNARVFMLSFDSRKKFLEIAQRIQNGKEVSLEDALFAGKMAAKDTALANILKQAQRRAFRDPEKPTVVDVYDKLNLGSADPEEYLDKESSIDDFADFFHRDPSEDWRRTD